MPVDLAPAPPYQLGFRTGVADARRALAEPEIHTVLTELAAARYTFRDRRHWLAGYAAGISFAVHEFRPATIRLQDAGHPGEPGADSAGPVPKGEAH